MFCAYCGKVVNNDAKNCPNCGTEIVIPKNMPSEPLYSEIEQSPYRSPNAAEAPASDSAVPVGMKEKKKWTAFVLCLLFGMLGAHRFYEGKKATAFLWMFTGGFFGVGYIIDLIILFCKPNPYYV